MSLRSKSGAGKSVRFSSENGLSRDPDIDASDVANEGRPKKRPRRAIDENFQHDEEDEVDNWVNDEDDDDDDGILTSERDVVNAKRNRRLKRQGKYFDDDFDDHEEEGTDADNDTSLMAEGDSDGYGNDIPVEPFNMKAESTDGSGYFEGDTYVFRRAKEADEGDAWLASLDEDDESNNMRTIHSTLEKRKTNSNTQTTESSDNDMDSMTKEELYAQILPLVSDSETIIQALVRYGNQIKQQSKDETPAKILSQKALNDLTLASNALLLQGDVDIYQKTRKDMMEMCAQADVVNPTKQNNQGPSPLIQWEYKGNQDGKVHGPYSTEDMLQWTQAGYFIGSQAVQVRTVRIEETTLPSSTKDELLSDLMEDDDDHDHNHDLDKKEKAAKAVRGEWISSNDVNFMAHS